MGDACERCRLIGLHPDTLRAEVESLRTQLAALAVENERNVTSVIYWGRQAEALAADLAAVRTDLSEARAEILRLTATSPAADLPSDQSDTPQFGVGGDNYGGVSIWCRWCQEFVNCVEECGDLADLVSWAATHACAAAASSATTTEVGQSGGSDE